MPVTLQNPGSELSSYQVMVTVPYDSDMQSDFDDIRFVAGDNSTVLSYWRKSYTASSTATFWVKVDSIPAGSSVIYMYYGNSSVSSASDGWNTFLLFDDFSDNDIVDWSTSGSGSNTGSIVAENYRMKLSVYKCYNVYSYQNLASYTGGLAFGFDWATQTQYWYEYPDWRVYDDGVGITLTKISGTDVTRSYGASYSGSLEKNGTLDGIPRLQFQITQSSYCANGDHGWNYFWVDNVTVRKYVSSEPVAGVGSEQAC